MKSGISYFIEYSRDVWTSTRSIVSSSLSVLPYLFGWSEGRREVTEQYPDPVSSRGDDDLPAKSRGLLYNDNNKCTGCKDCQNVCPSECIEIEVEPGRQASKKWVSVFNIDYGKCILCGLCVEVCQPQSLMHTKQYEFSRYRPEELIMEFGLGLVSPEEKSKWERLRKSEEVDEDLGW